MKVQPHFTKTIIETISESSTIKVLAKGTFLIREGDYEKHLYFVESGALRVFYLTELEEHTIRFGYQGSIINSLSSFIKGSPSEFYIEAIRKTKIRMIDKESFLRLVHQSTENQMQYIQLLETLITQQIEREIDLLISSPLERLERVLKRSPNLFQHIPLKYIAFYLRMSPETLSRIRNS
jgi:CRP-like cAMP-binding protein